MDPPYSCRPYVASVLGYFISMNTKTWFISKCDLWAPLKFQVRPETDVVEQIKVCVI